MAKHRHKRETNARRLPKAVQVSAPLAVVATLSAVTMGVLSATPSTSQEDLLVKSTDNAPAAAAELAVRAEAQVSRGQVRSGDRETESASKVPAAVLATRRAVRKADEKLWTSTELNLWGAAGQDAKQFGVVEGLKQVLVTGRRQDGRAEIVVNGQARWVTAAYLSEKKPEDGPSLGGSCTNGSSISAGRESLYEIHDVVCANWPEVTSYGTWRGDGEHGQGRAVDIMVSGPTGWAIADFLRANYAALGIEYIIYSQRIWSVERGGEGWRAMSDRGSATANHYDHVHVTVY